MQIAASSGATTSNRETLFNWGVVVLLTGLGGWIYSLRVTGD
jgi:hypothetical protein